MSNKILTEMEKSFIENFTLTGNATQSAEMSGYSKKTAKQQGYQLKERLQQEIDRSIKDKMRSSVPIAVETLKKLIEDTKIPPSTRLQAVNSLLDRTNHGATSTTQIEDITHKRSSEDLKQELNHLLSTLSIVKIKKEEDDNGNNGNIH